MKVAATCVSEASVKEQTPFPPHPPPDQPAKREPVFADAVKVTAPGANESKHVDPQEMFPGELVTVPEPVPALETVMVGYVPIPFSEMLAVGVAGSLEAIAKTADFGPVVVGTNAT